MGFWLAFAGITAPGVHEVSALGSIPIIVILKLKYCEVTVVLFTIEVWTPTVEVRYRASPNRKRCRDLAYEVVTGERYAYRPRGTGPGRHFLSSPKPHYLKKYCPYKCHSGSVIEEMPKKMEIAYIPFETEGRDQVYRCPWWSSG